MSADDLPVTDPLHMVQCIYELMRMHSVTATGGPPLPLPFPDRPPSKSRRVSNNDNCCIYLNCEKLKYSRFLEAPRNEPSRCELSVTVLLEYSQTELSFSAGMLLRDLSQVCNRIWAQHFSDRQIIKGVQRQCSLDR
jgi:hypothetical protein